MNRPIVPTRIRSLGEIFQQRTEVAALILNEALAMPDVRAGKIISRASDGFVSPRPGTPVR